MTKELVICESDNIKAKSGGIFFYMNDDVQ